MGLEKIGAFAPALDLQNHALGEVATCGFNHEARAYQAPPVTSVEPIRTSSFYRRERGRGWKRYARSRANSIKRHARTRSRPLRPLNPSA